MSRIETISHDALRLRRPILMSGRFSNWVALRRQRARLAQLDSSALDDIGLSHREAKSEARRPFWDVPESWRN